MTKRKLSIIAALLFGILVWAVPSYLGMGEAIDHSIYYISTIFVISALLGYLNKEEILSWPIGILLGQLAYVIGGMIMDPESASLWPLALFAITLYTLPTSFLGAYLGHYARR